MGRYHDLLLKKIWKDYQNEVYEYLEKYNDLKKYPFLMDSVQRFLTSDDIQFSLDGDMSCYELRTILDKVYSFLNPITEIVEVVDNYQVGSEVVSSDYDNLMSFWRKMLLGIRGYVIEHFGSGKMLENFEEMNNQIEMSSFLKSLVDRLDRLDRKHTIQRMYPGVDVSWLGDVAYEIIKRIGIERVKNKDFSNQDLTGIDLSSVNFDGVFYISGANLSYTNAHIDPQKIFFRSLAKCNLEGLDLSHANFTNVFLLGVNLRNTGARIDPQRSNQYRGIANTIL